MSRSTATLLAVRVASPLVIAQQAPVIKKGRIVHAQAGGAGGAR